jgi:hypothetical protein
MELDRRGMLKMKWVNYLDYEKNSKCYVYYMVHCDDATDSRTDMTFGLNQFDKLLEFLNECKSNDWKYRVYIEAFSGGEEEIIHFAELDLDNLKKEREVA